MKLSARLLSFTLALLIAMTSQQMAVARGMTTNAAGQVIVCTGQGVVTLTVDANGVPTDDPLGLTHFCPDCALTLLAFADAPMATQIAVTHTQTLGQAPHNIALMPVVPNPAKARDPPVSA